MSCPEHEEWLLYPLEACGGATDRHAIAELKTLPDAEVALRSPTACDLTVVDDAGRATVRLSANQAGEVGQALMAAATSMRSWPYRSRLTVDDDDDDNELPLPEGAKLLAWELLFALDGELPEDEALSAAIEVWAREKRIRDLASDTQ